MGARQRPALQLLDPWRELLQHEHGDVLARERRTACCADGPEPRRLERRRRLPLHGLPEALSRRAEAGAKREREEGEAQREAGDEGERAEGEAGPQEEDEGDEETRAAGPWRWTSHSRTLDCYS